MSNIVSTRVWTQSKQKRNHRLLLAALADGVNDQGVGFHGTRFLSEKILLSERQTRRLRDDLEATGEIYVRAGNGRGNETLYLVCTGLSEDEIVYALSTFFEMSEQDARNVHLSIEQKRWTFLNGKVDISETKVDKKRLKVDTIKRKSRTTINHITNEPLAANKSPRAKKVKPQLAIVEHRERDPFFDEIGKCLFDAITPAAINAVGPRIATVMYGDKGKKRSVGLLAFEADRQCKPIDGLDRTGLAQDFGVFWRNFKKNHPEIDLKDTQRVLEWWVKFRAAQDKQTQATDSGQAGYDENRGVWYRTINGNREELDPAKGSWEAIA